MGRSGGGGFGGGGFGGGGFGGGFSSGGIGGGFSGGSGGGGRSSGPGFGGPSMGGGYYGGGGNGFLGGLLLGGLLSDRRGGGYGGGGMPGGPDGGNGGGNGGNGQGPAPQGSGSCLTTIIVIFCAMLLCGVLVALMDGGACTAGGGTESTIEREPLPAGSVQETPYFTDAAGDWIANPSQLEQGMRQFYLDTGVQPYLYIEPNGAYTNPTALSQLAQEFYEENIPDQAHFVVFFCDNDQGGFNVGYWVGAQARGVLDSEALRIFQDCLNANYSDYSQSETEIFANTFRQTGERIMTTDAARNAPVYITVAVVFGVIVVVVIVAVVLRRRRIARAEELRRQEEILSKPLEKFGDQELQDLESKYADPAEPTEQPPAA